MKKKWLLMMLALAMSASIAACDFGDGESSTPDSQGSSISVQDSTADSTPEDSTPEDSTPEDSTPEDSTPEDSTPDDGGDGPTVETFCIKFVDQEGNVLSEQWLEEGAMPEIPTNVTVPEDTDYVTYTGAWDKEIVAVSDAAVTYTWVITSTKVTVQVTFDGENATDVAKGETVTAPSLKQLGKVVTGWTLNGEPVDLATYEVTEPVNFVSVWTAVPYATSGEAGINAVEWEEGAKWYYEIGTQTEVCDWDVNLPIMAYEEGKTVTYNYNGGPWIFVGINGKYVQGEGVGSEGTISITNVDGVLIVTIENTANPNTVVVKSSVNDADVVAGNKPLTLSVNNGAQYNQFFISKMPTVADSEIVTNLFDGTSGYAADGTAFAPSATSDTGATYTVKDAYGNGKISLPKVDYTKYTTVTMNFATSGWTQFGWNEHLFIYNSGAAVEGTITITYRDGKVYMVFESEGVTHPQGWDLSFSSTDIHTGNEALTLGYSCLAGTQSITISNFTMTEAPEVVSYAVKFVDSNGNVLSEQMVEEGKIPEIPTNTTTPENTETMIYTGAWDKEIVAAAGDVTYTWVVTSTEVKPANIFDSTSGYTSTGDMFAPSNTSETGASYTVKEEYGMGTISLPKVDFTKYTTVTMDFATSGWIQFGWGSNLFFYNSGSAVKGTITLTYRDNLVYMVFESEGVTQPQGWELYFSSTDIHTGNEALTLGYSCLAGTQSITISNFTMTEAPAVAPEEPVEPEEPEVPANLFDGTSGYAADGTAFAPSATSDTGASYTVKETYGNGKISLPKVDYTKYTTVTMDFATSGWTQFGWNEHLFIYNNATAVEGTITITYRDGKVYMVFESEGVAYPQGWDLSFSSTDIHTGNEALTLGYSCLAGTQSITISNFTMVETPETPEAPYTFEGTGVLDGSSNLLAAASITETGAVYNAPQDKDLYISLPKIDYTKVSKVTFDWQDSGWTKLGSGTAYYSENKADPSISGSVEIVNNGDGTLTFTFTYGEKVKTETITDADIINGTKAMTMKIKVYGNKPLTISNFTVVA